MGKRVSHGRVAGTLRVDAPRPATYTRVNVDPARAPHPDEATCPAVASEPVRSQSSPRAPGERAVRILSINGMRSPYRTAARRTNEPALERTDPSRAVTVVLVAAAALAVATALRPARDAESGGDRARLGASHHAREASSARGR